MAAPDKLEDAIAQQAGAFEPQRQYQWILRIPGIDGEKVLELSLRGGALPSESSEEIEIPILNGRVYVAGRQQYDSGSFTFNDYVDQDTMGLIGLWRDKIYNPKTKIQGYAANYKFKGELVLYGPDYTVERIWWLHGLWPQAVNNGTISYESSETVQIEVTFRYDRAVRETGWVG